MKLVNWLKANPQIKDEEIASRLGVSYRTLESMKRGTFKPSDPETIWRIVAMTNGKVRPSDFYGKPPEFGDVSAFMPKQKKGEQEHD